MSSARRRGDPVDGPHVGFGRVAGDQVAVAVDGERLRPPVVDLASRFAVVAPPQASPPTAGTWQDDSNGRDYEPWLRARALIPMVLGRCRPMSLTQLASTSRLPTLPTRA